MIAQRDTGTGPNISSWGLSTQLTTATGRFRLTCHNLLWHPQAAALFREMSVGHNPPTDPEHVPKRPPEHDQTDHLNEPRHPVSPPRVLADLLDHHLV